MRRILSGLLLLTVFFNLSACGRTYSYVGVNCTYSDFRLELPIKENNWTDGGNNSGFVTKMSMNQISKTLKEKKAKNGEITTEKFFGGRFLLVSYLSGDYTHYGLISSYFSPNTNDNFVFTNMAVSSPNYKGKFLIPLHLLNDAEVALNITDFTIRNKLDSLKNYETIYSITDFKTFYEKTGAFLVIEEENNLTITNKEITLKSPFFALAESLTIKFSKENEKNFVKFSF